MRSISGRSNREDSAVAHAMKTNRPSLFAALAKKPVFMSIGCLTVQVIATAYFIIDGIDDVLGELRGSPGPEVLMECVVAFALLMAVILGAHQLRKALKEAERNEAALQVARGSMSDLLNLRFKQWGLSRSEAEVALFALKGCTVSEIARMRQSAEGTVRSQLSQIYSKADVTSQSTLIALFIEELV